MEELIFEPTTEFFTKLEALPPDSYRLICRHCGAPVQYAPTFERANELRMHPGACCSKDPQHVTVFFELMALSNSTTACSLCHQPIGTDRANILGFDCLEVPQPEFQRLSDTVVHVSCLSRWARRDEFIAAWNRALGECFAGKRLLIDAAGLVDYTDPATWRMQPSPAVQQRSAEARAKREAAAQQTREDQARRMDAARQKAIALGLAIPADVDRVISEMPIEQFRQHLGEFNVSRAFFKK